MCDKQWQICSDSQSSSTIPLFWHVFSTGRKGHKDDSNILGCEAWCRSEDGSSRILISYRRRVVHTWKRNDTEPPTVKWIRCLQPLFRLAGLNTRGEKRRELFIFYYNLNVSTWRENPSVQHTIISQGRSSIIRPVLDWEYLRNVRYIIWDTESINEAPLSK
jgi:hypothetical protein